MQTDGPLWTKEVVHVTAHGHVQQFPSQCENQITDPVPAIDARSRPKWHANMEGDHRLAYRGERGDHTTSHMQRYQTFVKIRDARCPPMLRVQRNPSVSAVNVCAYQTGSLMCNREVSMCTQGERLCHVPLPSDRRAYALLPAGRRDGHA